MTRYPYKLEELWAFSKLRESTNIQPEPPAKDNDSGLNDTICKIGVVVCDKSCNTLALSSESASLSVASVRRGKNERWVETGGGQKKRENEDDRTKIDVCYGRQNRNNERGRQ